MKFVSLLVTAFLFSLTAQASPSQFDEIKKTGVLHAASEGAFPPFNYFKGKTLEGFEIDLTNEISKRIGVKKVEWKTYAFDSLLIGLGEKRYDLVAASHAITPERAKAVDFLNPYYCSGGVILTKSGGPQTMAALAKKTVAVAVGTTYAQFFDKGKGIEVKTFPKDVDGIQALLSNKVDALMTDKFVVLQLKKEGKLPGLVYSEIIEQERIAIAVHKGEPQLVAALNEGLSKVMSDGTYAKLSQKYFGEDIRCK